MNKLHVKKQRVVKLSEKRADVVATAKGGAALVDAFASSTRLWSDAAKFLPARRDPSQGFSTAAWFSALVHGLLTGGRGFSATEPMRGDTPLLAALGHDKAPSAETVEEVTKYLAAEGVAGHEALATMLRRQSLRLIGKERRVDLMSDGFALVWGDGTLIETTGKTKDALVHVKGSWGQMACGIFVGRYLVASDMARPVSNPEPGAAKSEGELNVTRRLLPAAIEVLREASLTKSSLFLMDSLYGENPTLAILEKVAGSRHIVGANKLARTAAVLSEQPDSQWCDTTAATRSRGWERSQVCVATIQCEGWEKKRTLVGRRWKKAGELFWNHAGVITNLDAGDPRVKAIMKTRGIGFAETVWHLYGRKQGMENQWKDLLSGMGLHAMPCGKAAVNAVFLAVAALALNLKTGCASLCLGKAGIMLWRFRRDVIDVAASVSRHARRAIVTLLDARDRICGEIDIGFAKLAAL